MSNTQNEDGDLVIQDEGEVAEDGLTAEERRQKREQNAIAIWLARFSSEQTRRAYEGDIQDWMAHLVNNGHSLFTATLEDAVTYQKRISGYSRSTQARKISSIKSLYSLLKKIGVMSFDVLAVVRVPSIPSQKAKRYLTEGEVFRLFAAASNPRNRALLHLLYYGPLRAQEASNLTWGDLVERPDFESGQVEVFGKGKKSRTCPLPASIWEHLLSIKSKDARETDPVFRSRKKGPISTNQIRRVVRDTTKRAGIDKPVSPHWLRHAHVTHADERGCPMPVICAQVGHKDPSTTYRYIHTRPHDASSFYLPV